LRTSKKVPSIPRGAVLANALRELAEYRQSPAWLNNSIPFNHDLRLTDGNKSKAAALFKLCGITNRKENRLSFEVLTANLIEKRGKRPIAISLNRNHWKISRYNKLGGGIIKIVNVLHTDGYIEMRKGYYYADERRETRIWALDKFLHHFPRLSDGVVYKPTEVVELRDAKKKLIDYRDTSKTNKIRAILKQANDVNGKADIRCYNDQLVAFLFAIFQEEFSLYGRLHTRGYRHYQGFGKDERADITINGDPVVELDFSALHPHLLYAKEGLQLSRDPYLGILPIQDPDDVRDFLKEALLSLLNASGRYITNESGKQWYMTAAQVAQAGINERLGFNADVRNQLKAIGITRACQIIEKFKEAHTPIAHHFCQGKKTGMQIMNLDARIALDIVNHFAKKNIPILAIHDSFIVQARHEKELRNVMELIYSKHTKGFTCPIK